MSKCDWKDSVVSKESAFRTMCINLRQKNLLLPWIAINIPSKHNNHNPKSIPEKCIDFSWQTLYQYHHKISYPSMVIAVHSITYITVHISLFLIFLILFYTNITQNCLLFSLFRWFPSWWWWKVVHCLIRCDCSINKTNPGTNIFLGTVIPHIIVAWLQGESQRGTFWPI